MWLRSLAAVLVCLTMRVAPLQAEEISAPHLLQHACVLVGKDRISPFEIPSRGQRGVEVLRRAALAQLFEQGRRLCERIGQGARQLFGIFRAKHLADIGQQTLDLIADVLERHLRGVGRDFLHLRDHLGQAVKRGHSLICGGCQRLDRGDGFLARLASIQLGGGGA